MLCTLAVALHDAWPGSDTGRIRLLCAAHSTDSEKARLVGPRAERMYVERRDEGSRHTLRRQAW
jgi:hypothetical protein